MKIPREILTELARKALEMTHAQIASGKDIDGNPYSYSTRPFVRPAGKSGIPASDLKRLEKSGEISLFKSKQSGKLWMMVHGGYKSLRTLAGRNPEGDFLAGTGNMLASMTSRPQGDNSVVMGFANQRSAEKAFYLNVAGAGKGRKLWRFMGLTKENIDLIADEFGKKIMESDAMSQEIRRVLKASGINLQ